MPAKTVLHVIDALNVGGAQELVALLAERKPKDQGMAVLVLQPVLDLKARIEAAGVPVHACNRPRPSIVRPLKFLAYALGGMRDIMRLRKQTGADVIHGHLSDAEFLSVAAGKLCGARKICLTFHTPKLLPEQRRIADPRNLLRVWAMGLLYRMADSVVAVSEQTLNALRDVLGLKPPRLTYIPNGVDCDALSGRKPPEGLRAALGLSPGDKVLLNLGRLVELKGQGHIIEAVARLASRHPELKLLIAGEGPARQSLETLVAARGMGDRVKLLGNRDDAPDLLALADIVVGASLWEGTSLALMEAMAAGKAIVATDIPGNRELFSAGRQALLIPPAAPEAMAEAIARLLDDPELAGKLAESARKKALSQFDIGRVVADYEALWA